MTDQRIYEILSKKFGPHDVTQQTLEFCRELVAEARAEAATEARRQERAEVLESIRVVEEERTELMTKLLKLNPVEAVRQRGVF